MQATKHSLRVALLALGATLSLCSAAQDSPSRKKEALRRTQAALRDAQQQQATLAKEKDELAGQRDKLDADAKRSQSQLAAARSDAAHLNAGLAHAADELAATKAHDESQRKELEDRLADQERRLAQAQRVADERARANAALVALLERATQSLARAEQANGQMHALGLQMIDRLRGGAPSGADPVIGFGQVRLENEAEALRDKLDAAKLPTAPRAAADGK